MILEFDSAYAAACAQSHARARANIQMVLLLRDELAAASSLCSVRLRKVESHTGATLNEHADALASAGAAGFLVGGAETLLNGTPHPTTDVYDTL